MIISLGKGKSALIDGSDYDRVKHIKWHPMLKHSIWYARGFLNEKTVLLHRVVLGAKLGEWVDHINHNGLDCRQANLRIVTPSQNAMNARVRRDSKTKFRGVTIIPSTAKLTYPYWARIMVKGNPINLGYFKTAIEAANAYNDASHKYHGDFGCRNVF